MSVARVKKFPKRQAVLKARIYLVVPSTSHDCHAVWRLAWKNARKLPVAPRSSLCLDIHLSPCHRPQFSWRLVREIVAHIDQLKIRWRVKTFFQSSIFISIYSKTAIRSRNFMRPTRSRLMMMRDAAAWKQVSNMASTNVYASVESATRLIEFHQWLRSRA